MKKFKHLSSFAEDSNPQLFKLNESDIVDHSHSGDCYIGITPGTHKHSKMQDIMRWTKDADPELHKKIMNLD